MFTICTHRHAVGNTRRCGRDGYRCDPGANERRTPAQCPLFRPSRFPCPDCDAGARLLLACRNERHHYACPACGLRSTATGLAEYLVPAAPARNPPHPS